MQRNSWRILTQRLIRARGLAVLSGRGPWRVGLLLATLCLSLFPAASGDDGFRITEAFPTGFWHSLTGACFHEGFLHAVAKGNVLLRYDTSTGEMLEQVDPMIPGLTHSHIHSIAPDGAGSFWVAEVHSRQLFRLRFADYSTVSTIPFPENPTPVFGMTFDHGALWVGYHSGGPTMPIHKLDPETGEILEVLDPGTRDAHGLAWVGDYLWIIDSLGNSLYRVDRTGQIRDVFALRSDTWASLAFDGARFWTSNLSSFYRIDVPTSTLCPPPGEVRNLVFTGPSSLSWDEPTVLGGSPAVYDTLRSDDPADFATLPFCVESSDGTDQMAQDDDVPGAGDVFYYLVGARNLCPNAPGPLGADSEGIERESVACP